jgi:hypothetical protein
MPSKLGSLLFPRAHRSAPTNAAELPGLGRSFHPTGSVSLPDGDGAFPFFTGGTMYDKFAPLLEQALTEPGIVSQAFRRFHRFSVGNQILAAIQLRQKCLPLSPIASFSRWKALGRSVCKGQKALFLWMPITVKRREPDVVSGDSGDSDGSDEVFTRFKLAPRWFSLSAPGRKRRPRADIKLVRARRGLWGWDVWFECAKRGPTRRWEGGRYRLVEDGLRIRRRAARACGKRNLR